MGVGGIDSYQPPFLLFPEQWVLKHHDPRSELRGHSLPEMIFVFQ